MLIAQTRYQGINWDRCLFVHYIGTFWYIVSKKFLNHSENIHLWRHWRRKTLEICKLHQNWWFLKVSNVLQITPQQKLRSLWYFKLNLKCGSLLLTNLTKIRAVVVEIFAKHYWLLKTINFQCILHISTVLHLQSLQRWIITV